MPGSSRRHSTTPEYSSREVSDRRHSTSSDTSLPDNTHFRQLSQEHIEYIPTRITKVNASKPAANPLQFVKVGPCDLYRSAQEQLKKVEEVKKLKQEKKDEAEDWQSNLDNWKSSRRKRQEHIIERVVEVKKLELEEYDRNRRRSKTFNEMMEDRNTRGRKMSLVMYKEEDINDFRDLGIGTSSGKSSVSEDFGNDDNHSVSDREEMETSQYETQNGRERKNGLNGHHDDVSAIPDVSSPELEEYTYERAIQSYVNFTETRVKSKAAGRKSSRGELDDSKENNSVSDKLPNGHSMRNGRNPPPLPAKPRRESNPKLDARLTAIEQRRRSSSTDLNSIPDSSRTLPLPKVDVLKRRELFEKASENNEQMLKGSNKVANTNLSIKERLSNLEKHTDASSNISLGNRRISGTEISSSVKERLSSLQKQKSTDSLNDKDTVKTNHRLSSGDVSSSQSIRERLSNLEKQGSVEERKDNAQTGRQSEDFSHSIKERLSSPDTTSGKDDGRRVSPNKDPGLKTKTTSIQNTESQQPESSKTECISTDKSSKLKLAESERSTSPDEEEIYPNKRQQFHRSLDSLDVESPANIVNEAFERVQSLEDLDCCSHNRNYPASASSTEMLAFSSQSGDTDREDSGIHTADVSCSVSQADEPVEDGEIITTISSVVPHFGRDSYHLEMELVNHKRQGSGVSEQLSPIPQEESTAFLNVESSASSSLDPSPTFEDGQAVHSPTDSSCNELTRSSPEDAAMAVVTSEAVVKTDIRQQTDDNVMKEDVADFLQVSSVLEEEAPAINKVSKSQITSVNEVQQTPMLQEKMMNIMLEQNQEEPISPTRLPHYNSHREEEMNEEVFIPVSTNQIPPLSLSSNIEIVSGLAFHLGPPSSAEPPKEKPPPPPMELSDEDTLPPEPTLRRLDSTKRIKKEIRRKRSDFLGIEGNPDDSYLETEMQVAPPPDMTTFLVEERRLEQQLYRQSICSESDSNLGETTESRDSGVELERGHSDDAWSSKQPLTPEVLSTQHSRQNSELYGNASITSEEDEITKKEREIIEILEKEEQWRYGNNTSNQQNNIGEKLAEKLRQLEQEKLRLEWERTEEVNRRQEEENIRREDERRLRAKEQELRQQEESLRAEREHLQREQENLIRQQQQWSALPQPVHLSLQDVSGGVLPVPMPPQPVAMPTNYRSSLPDLQQEPRRPPPPIPPAKPLRTLTQEQRERDNSIRSSRMPSADSLPQQVEPVLTHAQQSGQQMSRQTLQALSAVPRSRLISTDNWIQAKKKPEGHRTTLNNQHWLIQEAEHRRITEQQQRIALSPRKTSPPQPQPQPQPQPHQPQPQYWGNHQQPPRQEKPLPDSIIQTLTQRVQNRVGLSDAKKAPNRMRFEESPSREVPTGASFPVPNNVPTNGNSPAITNGDSQEKMLSVSGKKKCSHCGEELGRGAAMIIESLRLFYHIDCFKCCVCHVQLGDGLMGTDVRVRNNKLHCHNCYSSDDGVKFSCV